MTNWYQSPTIPMEFMADGTRFRSVEEGLRKNQDKIQQLQQMEADNLAEARQFMNSTKEFIQETRSQQEENLSRFATTDQKLDKIDQKLDSKIEWLAAMLRSALPIDKTPSPMPDISATHASGSGIRLDGENGPGGVLGASRPSDRIPETTRAAQFGVHQSHPLQENSNQGAEDRSNSWGSGFRGNNRYPKIGFPVVGEFNKLFQTNDVESYNEEFEELRVCMFAYNPALPESYFISSYISGLKQEIKNLVKLSRPKTLAAAYEEARSHHYAIQAIISDLEQEYSDRSNSMENSEDWVADFDRDDADFGFQVSETNQFRGENEAFDSKINSGEVNSGSCDSMAALDVDVCKIAGLIDDSTKFCSSNFKLNSMGVQSHASVEMPTREALVLTTPVDKIPKVELVWMGQVLTSHGNDVTANRNHMSGYHSPKRFSCKMQDNMFAFDPGIGEGLNYKSDWFSKQVLEQASLNWADYSLKLTIESHRNGSKWIPRFSTQRFEVRLHGLSESPHYSSDLCAGMILVFDPGGVLEYYIIEGVFNSWSRRFKNSCVNPMAVSSVEDLVQLTTQIPGEFAEDRSFPFDPGGNRLTFSVQAMVKFKGLLAWLM